MSKKDRLNFAERVKIQDGIENNQSATLASIAKKLNRSSSTIYREILLNRDCEGSKQLRFMKEKPQECSNVKVFPFCCNNCSRKNKCSKFIYVYDAAYADYKAKIEIHSRNKKPRVDKSQMDKIDNIVSTAILVNKEPIYNVKLNNPELPVSESTIRRYINNGYLKAKTIDLPRTVQRIYKKEYSYEQKKNEFKAFS